MTQFDPFPYSVTGPSGSGMPMPSAPPAQALPQDTRTIVAHSREVDLRTISGDIDPPVITTSYTRDFFFLMPADCAIQRLRLSAGRNGQGCKFGFVLMQLDGKGVLNVLYPATEVRSLDLTPTDYDSSVEVLPDVPVILRITGRYQQVTVFATIEALYTSRPAQ